jgi:hypothetical protein
VVDVNH